MTHAETGLCRGLRPTLLGFVALALVATTSAQREAPDWPQWRGPDRDGISKAGGWNAKSKKELWSNYVGTGYSTVSIVDGRLYTQGHWQEKERDTIYCMNAETGKILWKHSFPAQTMARMHGGGTLSTPSVDGKRLFASNREGKMFCLDSKSGKVLWSKDLKETYNLRTPRWGFAASPFVLDEMVVMNVGLVLAFKKDGELIWKTSDNYGDSYSTPVDLTLNNRKCLAVFTGEGLAILERKSGRELAFHEWTNRPRVNAATPVVVGSKIFISSGYNRGCAMLQASDKELEVLWESRVMRTQQSGCVAYENHLYGFDESTFKCLDMDGNVKWSKRGLGKGAFVIADGRLVIMSQRGDLVIAEATAEEYRELSRNGILYGGVCWTTPVVYGGRIYCRNSMGDLLCMDHRSGTK